MSTADRSRAPEAHLTREQAPEEPTGPVASDSLAAESIKAGGGFSENANPEVLGVKGAQSTLATTDTSGASVLHPAASGAAREKQDEMGLGSDEKGVSGVKYPEAAGETNFDGSHNLDGYTGGPSSGKPTSGYDTTSASGGNPGAVDGDARTAESSDARDIPAAGESAGASAPASSEAVDGDVRTAELSDARDVPAAGDDGDDRTLENPDSRDVPAAGESADTSSGPSAGAGVRPYVDEAPSSQSGILPPGSQKPKGTNLTEGGIPETKTFTGDVGGPHDPGRLAEQQFQNKNANTDFGAGQQETGEVEQGDKGGFEVLESERA